MRLPGRSLRRLRAMLLGVTLAASIAIVGVAPALAGTPLAQIDIGSVGYLDTGQLLVEGTVLCAADSRVAKLYRTDGTWILASQTPADGSDIETTVGGFADQVICDGAPHPWQVTLDQRVDQPFDRALPVNVVAQISVKQPPHPRSELHEWEEFVAGTESPPTPAVEPLQLDVVDVTLLRSGKARVQATVSCPAGYTPFERPGLAGGIDAARAAMDQDRPRRDAPPDHQGLASQALRRADRLRWNAAHGVAAIRRSPLLPPVPGTGAPPRVDGGPRRQRRIPCLAVPPGGVPRPRRLTHVRMCTPRQMSDVRTLSEI